MKTAINTDAASMQGLIVRHDAFCPMAYGEGSACAPGCKPVAELVDIDTLAATMARDFKNRAQRRDAAKAARKAKS
jgi:hypothetical protein